MDARDLVEVLQGLPTGPTEGVVVGADTLDDAAAVRWPVGSAPAGAPLLVQTVDFITPLVDDAYDFGAIAAANALSDIYAMGARPRFALNIVGFPRSRLPLSVLRAILTGGADAVAGAGACVVGGHSVDDPELKYGLVVTGDVPPAELITNAGGQVGDLLVLTKAIGTGLVSGAIKDGTITDYELAALTASMRSLNAAAGAVMFKVGAHAATDVTGFGLLGHLMQLARASGKRAVLDAGAVPRLPGAFERAERLGGAARRNVAYVGEHLRTPLPDPWLRFLADPQTSGGLLIALPRNRVAALASEIPMAVVIGALEPVRAPEELATIDVRLP